MRRPTSVTVFGVLNIIFGALGVLGTAFTVLTLLVGPRDPFLMFEQSAFMNSWMKVSTVLGGVASVVLIAAGGGLLAMRNWGRFLSIGYAAYAIVTAIIGTAITIFFVLMPILRQMEQADAQAGPTESAALVGGVIGGVIGSVVSLIYPALLWFYMTRRHVVAAFGGTFVEEPELYETTGTSSDNPYASPVTSEAVARVVGVSRSESVLETVIPVKNGAALTSYYLGLFSLFPLLGFPLAIAAVILGVNGLKNVRRNPEVRGGVHAWIGLICGILFGLFNLALLVIVGFALVAAFLGRG